MGWKEVAVACVGLVVCCFGFLKRPHNSLELISARFVIPLMVASATFLQIFWHAWQDNTPDIYYQCRVDAGYAAGWFVVVSMLCFWVGYALPVGRASARLLHHLGAPVSAGRRTVQSAHAICCLAIGVYILRSTFPDVVEKVPGIAPFTMVTLFVGAVLLGLSFPEKEQRGPFDLILVLAWIIALSLPIMASFSRGVGVPALATAAAYSVRRGRLNWLGLGVAVFWAVICAEVGLTGRGAVGHYAGIVAWIQYLFTGFAWWDPISAFQTAMYANDSFTPLCVSIKASSVTWVSAMTPVDWMLFQIPLPHIFSFSPVYTMELTRYIGGAGSWGYTPSIFGDVIVHLGWLGAGMFIIVGWSYRVIDELAFAPVPPGSFNPYFLLSVFGYMAMGLGLFGMFRTWNTALFDGLCFVVALLWIRNIFSSRNYAEEQPVMSFSGHESY